MKGTMSRITYLSGALLLCLVVAQSGFAADSSILNPANELKALVGAFESNFGLFLGLLTAFIGLWRIVVAQQVMSGLILIILGVLINMFPKVFDGFRSNFYGVATDLGGSGDAGARVEKFR